MRLLPLAIASLATTVAIGFVACESKPAPRPTCDSLGELCHESTDPKGIECHELGEAPTTTEAKCQAEQAACLAVCTGAGGAGGGGAGGGGAGGGGAGGGQADAG